MLRISLVNWLHAQGSNEVHLRQKIYKMKITDIKSGIFKNYTERDRKMRLAIYLGWFFSGTNT